MKAYRKICWTALILFFAVLLFFSTDASLTRSVAYAYLPESYFNAVSDEEGDWYFKENYLNIAAVKTVVDGWKADPNYDFAALELNPVKIAVIDSGIGWGYTVDGNGTKTEAPCTDYYGAGINYQISPFFDDVLLKDSSGNIVYKNATESMEIKTSSSTVREDEYVYESGDAATDLADNTQDNHGTHVTSTVGILIKALGLEKYIKIIPIKANTSISKLSGATKYTATYQKSKMEDAIDFAINKGADVINLSMASSESGFTFSENTDNAVIVAAAGNDGINCVRYPAAASGVLGVMNYGKGSGTPTLSLTSNYGSSYDICAPGSSITALIDGKDGYGKLSGTSMASPVVSFACAFLKMRYRANKELDLTSSMIRELMPECSSITVSKSIYQFKALDLYSIATADFANNRVYAETIYGSPSAISVSAPDVDNMTLGDTLTLNVNYFPLQSATNGKIEWYYIIDDVIEKFAEGERASFAPDTVGSYSIYCSLEQDGKEDVKAQNILIYVGYKNLEEVTFELKHGNNSIDAAQNLKIEAGEELNLSMDGMQYVNPSLYALKWYVNGDLVSTDADYRFVPVSYGTYEISAKVNDNVTIMSLTVDVSNFAVGDGEIDGDGSYTFDDPNKEKLGLIIGCTFAGIAFLAEIGAALYFLKKKKRSEH